MGTAYQKLGRYLLMSEIASGGMATVYRGKLIGIEGFEKDVAIKKILPLWSHNPEFVAMLIDEAKVLVPLHHNNIVQVFELGKEGESYFIVMEFVDGFDLKKILTKLRQDGNKLPLALAYYITQHICLGLEFAHTRKTREGQALRIVHRDISPQNILISREGDVKITDFGIAKVIGKTNETATGVLKGKFSYMSPEQALGQDIDGRTDVFALGALFYEMIFGQKCFDGRNDFEIIEKVKNADVSYSDDTIEPLVNLLTRALAKEPDQRYQSAGEFMRAIIALEKELPARANAFDLKHFIDELFGEEFFHTSATLSPGPAEAGTLLNRATVIENPDLIATVLESPVEIETIVNEKTILEEKTLLDTRLRLPKKIPSAAGAETRVLPATIAPLKVRPVNKSRNQIVQWGLIVAAALLSYQAIQSLNAHFQAERFADATLKPVTIEKAAPPTEAVLANLNPTQPPPVLVPTPEPIAPPTQTATFTVTVIPANAVLSVNINGKKASLAPGSKQSFTFSGENAFVAVSASSNGYKTQSHTMTFSANHLRDQINFDLEKMKFGTVSISAQPWGSGRVSGAGTHELPSSFHVPIGNQTVSVYYPPKKKAVSRSITVNENGTVRCRAVFGAQDSLTCN
jgi:serine/threonine protein kinase